MLEWSHTQVINCMKYLPNREAVSVDPNSPISVEIIIGVSENENRHTGIAGDILRFAEKYTLL